VGQVALGATYKVAKDLTLTLTHFLSKPHIKRVKPEGFTDEIIILNTTVYRTTNMLECMAVQLCPNAPNFEERIHCACNQFKRGGYPCAPPSLVIYTLREALEINRIPIINYWALSFWSLVT
jgi:hypothetical protein